MAAGLGFKDFTTGEVLTAADVDGYLMQGVWVFASAAARDAAVTSPQEGNFAYLKDTNVTTYYTGSAWANLDTTGMTNPMTTTGDTIYSSSGSTPARLGIGTANQVLRVNSGATAPEWATVSSGGMTLISTTTMTGSSITLSSIPGTYNDLVMVIRNYKPDTNAEQLLMRLNGVTSGAYNTTNFQDSPQYNVAFSTTTILLASVNSSSAGNGLARVLFNDYANTTSWKTVFTTFQSNDSTTSTRSGNQGYLSGFNQTGAISSITLLPTSGNFTSGTVLLYGVK